MDNLFEIRQDIKYRLVFQKKLKDYPRVAKFFFTLEKFLNYKSNYEAPAKPEKRGYGLFSSMSYRKAVPSLKEKYPTFEDYLYMVVFKGTMPADYNLIGRADTSISLHKIKKCLSHWDATQSLYYKLRKRIEEANADDLHLVDGEPSVWTIHKLLTQEDYNFLKEEGKNKTKLPFVALLPFMKFWRFHKGEAKEALQISLGAIIFAILGIVGILVDKQPYTWIGAAVIGIIIACILGGIIYNIVTLFTKGTPEKGEWVPGFIGFAAGVVFFFFTYSVTPPERPSYHSSPQHYYQAPAYDETDNVTVYTTEYGECYHSTPNCPSLSRSRNIYSTTRGTAKRSYRPCQRCH